jgi:hypothetical protein
MRWIKTVGSEIYGLFVDDGSFAIAIIIWVGFAWLALPRFGLATAANAGILFTGLILILLESVMRRAAA